MNPPPGSLWPRGEFTQPKAHLLANPCIVHSRPHIKGEIATKSFIANLQMKYIDHEVRIRVKIEHLQVIFGQFKAILHVSLNMELSFLCFDYVLYTIHFLSSALKR